MPSKVPSLVRLARLQVSARTSVLLFLFWTSWAQASSEAKGKHRGHLVETSGSVVTGYSAFQDQLALSFVYSGMLLGGRIGQRYTIDDSLISWDFALEASINGSHGMPAIQLELSPWDGAYLHRVRTSAYEFWLGAGVSGSYRLWLNPMINSGHFYWLTHYSLDLRASFPFSVHRRDFRIDVAIAALSLASRPAPAPDPYFYSWNFGDIFADAHSNMRFASVNRIRRLDVVGHWFLRDKCWAPMMRFSYEAYMPDPRLQTLEYAVGVTWH